MPQLLPLDGQTEWTPEKMGQKCISRVIIRDEVCTVPRSILQTFLVWLDQRGIQVICCGDQGHPPPISSEVLHEWLGEHLDYYEEMSVDKEIRRKLLLFEANRSNRDNRGGLL